MGKNPTHWHVLASVFCEFPLNKKRTDLLALLSGTDHYRIGTEAYPATINLVLSKTDHLQFCPGQKQPVRLWGQLDRRAINCYPLDHILKKTVLLLHRISNFLSKLNLAVILPLGINNSRYRLDRIPTFSRYWKLSTVPTELHRYVKMERSQSQKELQGCRWA